MRFFLVLLTFLKRPIKRFKYVENLPHFDVQKTFSQNVQKPTWNVFRTFRKRPIVSWVGTESKTSKKSVRLVVEFHDQEHAH